MPIQTSSRIFVSHEIQVAHRLSLLPGKCEQIHGHSMGVELSLFGDIDENGILAGLDFGDVKKAFRGYLDNTYDHRLLLNENDPWAKPVHLWPYPVSQSRTPQTLPGVLPLPGDPTTENLAKWICQWAWECWGKDVDGVQVCINETCTNGAVYEITEEYNA